MLVLACLGNPQIGMATLLRTSPDTGIRSAVLNARPGDTILLQAGNFSGLDNCGLVLSIPDLTIQGQGILTKIICSGQYSHRLAAFIQEFDRLRACF